MANLKCKICRRSGIKLFLKGERCLGAKCSIVKRPYAPGPKGKRRTRALSEFGKELKEKQKLRNWYNLRERQFANYIEEATLLTKKSGDATEVLIGLLETRFDNVVFRLGLASSRVQARQMVSHGHFLVNGRPINIPSFRVKKGDTITIKPNKLKKGAFLNLAEKIKKQKTPAWLTIDASTFEGKVIGLPSFEEAAPPVEISSIFEYYSR